MARELSLKVFLEPGGMDKDVMRARLLSMQAM